MEKLIILLFSFSIFLIGCIPAKKVAKFDKQTGVIQVEAGKKLGDAKIVKASELQLNKYKDFIFFTSNEFYKEYGYNQLKEIGYFKQVMKYDDLEKLVISNNLQDKVIDLNSQIGLSRLANNHKPFLWANLTPWREENEQYMKLIVTNAGSAEVLFEAATLSKGSTDESVLYPLFNELSIWIRKNS